MKIIAHTCWSCTAATFVICFTYVVFTQWRCHLQVMWIQIYVQTHFSISITLHYIDIYCIITCWLKSLWTSSWKYYYWLTLECSMSWKSTSFTERTWSPSCNPALWASESGTTCQHTYRNHNVNIFEKHKIGEWTWQFKKTHQTWGIHTHTHTLDIKIPSCEAFPPRMLKPSCAPGGFFSTIVRGRNWVSSLL